MHNLAKWILSGLVCLPALGDVCTSRAAGPASQPSTWTGCITRSTPGEGDQVVLNHAVDFMESRTVGTDPANNTAYAIQVNAAGRMNIAAGVTIISKGPIYNNAGTVGGAIGVQLGAGSSLLIAEPSATISWQIVGGTRAVWATSGTTNTAPTTLGSVDLAAQTKRATLLTYAGAVGNYFSADHLVIQNLVSALMYAGTTGTASHDVNRITSGTFRNVGQISVQWASADAKHRWTDITIENSSAGSSNSQLFFKSVGGAHAYISGNSYLRNLRIAPGQNGNMVGALCFNDYVPLDIDHVLAAGKIYAVTASVIQANATKVGPNSMTNVVMIDRANTTRLWNGASFEWIYSIDDASTTNAGPWRWHAHSNSASMANSLFLGGSSVAAEGSGDWINIKGTGYSPLLKNLVWEPSQNGFSPGKFIALYAFNAATDCSTPRIENSVALSSNTVPGYNAEQGLVGVGEVGVGGSIDCGPDTVKSLRNNIAWAPPEFSDRRAQLLLRQQSNTVNYVLPGNIEGNWVWSPVNEDESTGMYRFAGYRSTAVLNTPSALSGTSDPRFVDRRRSWPYASRNFFEALHGISHPNATNWTSGVSYTPGNVVRSSTPGVWGGDTVYYTCISAHTAGSSTKPDSGSSWRSNWRWTTFDDLWANPHLLKPYLRWAMGGWKVQNGAMRRTGAGAADIGVGFDGCHVQAGVTDACSIPNVF